MPNPPFEKKINGTLEPITGMIKGYYTYPKRISPKGTVILLIGFERAYCSDAVEDVSHFSTECLLIIRLSLIV